MTGKLAALFILAGLVLSASASRAAREESDAAWPCPQPLAPENAVAARWHGPSPEGKGDWQSEPAVAALVQRIAPRNVDIEAGKAAIASFIQDLPKSEPERERLIALAFAGLQAETRRERSSLIDRIKQLGERQRKLTDLVARLTAEYDAIPANAQGEDAQRRADLAQRRAYTTRTFEEVQRTMRYACEAPAALDARLGAYDDALAAAQ